MGTNLPREIVDEVKLTLRVVPTEIWPTGYWPFESVKIPKPKIPFPGLNPLGKLRFSVEVTTAK
jgi:hypothetical protein